MHGSAAWRAGGSIVHAAVLPLLHGCSCILLCVGVGGAVYVVGGTSAGGQLSAAIRTYSPTTKSWSQAGSLPSGAAYSRAAESSCSWLPHSCCLPRLCMLVRAC